MKPTNETTQKKWGALWDRFAFGGALVVVTLLVTYWLVPGSPEPHAIIKSPQTAHASLSPDHHDHDHMSMDQDDTASMHQSDKTRYACPMMCVPPSDEPGRCPVCGMALTPVQHHDETATRHLPQLRLPAASVHLAEIQTIPVVRKTVTNEVRLFGRIDYDSAHMTKITAFMPGVVDRVYVKRAGQFVRWGDPLFDIYSSDLLETQRQLVDAMQYVPGFLAFQANTPHVAQDVPVQARKRHAAGSKLSPEQKEALQKIKALRHKLSILGLPKRDIDEFMKKGEATGIATVYAPMYGQVTIQGATEGTFVNTGASLFTIADPQYVWARLDAYESDYPWIRIGQRVTFTTEAYPGEMFEAKVVYIDPVFDPATRTFSIGAITTDDQGGRLKAGMLVRAVTHARLNARGRLRRHNDKTQNTPLVIPASAPLITGTRAVVNVALPGETPIFEGREVVLGPRANDHYVVYSGLSEGEMVVTNGNFKIDSAMQILAKASLMAPAGGMPVSGHEHHAINDRRSTSQKPENSVQGTANHMDADDEHSNGENDRADAHQYPDLSDQMHDRYMHAREMSRTADDSEEMHEHNRPKQRHVVRRKPGQYGDTTRQGASQLEEHRKKWRKP